MILENDEHIYPIGKYKSPEYFDAKTFADAIEEIKVLPRILDFCVENLDETQLNTSYRASGWTIHQIIHHIADSHMNAFVRCKLLLTEDNPTIKPYNQDLWAITADVTNVPFNFSTTIIHALHHRWVALLGSLKEEEMMRTYYHPEYKNTVALWQVVNLYAWHGRHHAEQIRQLRVRKGW